MADASSAARPWYEAFAPATVSNLGPGFDVLGLALTEPGDRVRVRRCEGSQLRIAAITGDGGRLPTAADRNTATVAVRCLLERIGRREGLEFEVHKGLPLGSGLGSSGASACAALVAACAALELELPVELLIDCAREGERLACGSAHPDNVAPALMGGLVMIPATDPLRVLRLPLPRDLWFVVYTPGCEVRTADARAVLPREVGLDAAVRHAAKLGTLVHALHTEDYALLGEAISDEIIEPARAGLIPGFLEAKTNALEAGALACSISGAGPTCFALTDDASRGRALLEILDEAFTHAGVPGQGRVGQVGPGARLVGEPMH